MTESASAGRLQRRIMCALLAMLFICTGIMVHSHECLETAAIYHVHVCADGCCTVCAFRSVITCAMLFISSKLAVRCILGYRIERRGAPPEESEGTLVQLKVKLSN